MTRHTIRTAGADVTVDETGGGDPVLLFLHYWGGTARTWDRVIACLPAGVRCLALNQRGWGGSVARDGRHDLQALADDALAVAGALGARRMIAVGHSMGGKVAQILAGRRSAALRGLVLVAPAPPTAMPVPEEARAAMLASYQTREGVLQALGVLAGSPLPPALREQVIEDTLGGDPDAKRAWTERGMTEAIDAELADVAVPVEVVLGGIDQVEREAALRPVLSRVLPQAAFSVVPGSGHLLPLEAPEAVAAACMRMVAAVA